MAIRLSGLEEKVVFSTPANFDYSIIQTQNIDSPKSLTLVIEATIDGGSTWFMVPAQAIGRGTQVTQIWTNGRWFVETFSFDAIRVRVAEYTSGFADVAGSPGEIVAGRITDTLSNRMPVDTGLSLTADDEARRRDELESLKTSYPRSNELYHSDNYGSEVR